jgi:hypothetical protein
MALTGSNANTLAKEPTTTFNGQQVVTGDWYKQGLTPAAKMHNDATGENLSPEQYDRWLNPDTAGARWGDTDPMRGATTPAATGSQNPGLLTPSNSTVPAAATQATATTYDPTKQVMSDGSSVQNQIANITASGSKLNTLAEAEANKQVNRRGLLNSSVAVGAGQKAVLQSALPIAQQDASTNASADAANAQYANSASQFNAGAQNTASQTNANLGTQVSLANSGAANTAALQTSSQQATAALQTALARIQADTTLSAADKQIKSQQLISQNQINSQQSISDKENQNKLQLQQIDSDTKKVLATLDSDSKTKLSQLEADNRQLLQTNISAANEYAQYVQALSSIQTNQNMDGTAKQQAADSQLAALQASLKAIGAVSGLDLSKYFQSATFPTTQTDTNSGNPADNRA